MKAKIGENKLQKKDEKTHMNIAILFEHPHADEKGIQLTAQELGINLDFIPFRKVSVCIGNGEYSIKSKRKDYTEIFDNVDVVLNRAQSRNRRLLAANVIEAFDKGVINPSSVEFTCFSKLRTLLRLWNEGVKIPLTVYVPCNPQEQRVGGGEIHNEEEIAHLIQQKLGHTDIVVKPDAGSHGKDIRLAKNHEDLLQILEKVEPSITHPVGVLAQELVPKWFYDLRIIVYKESGKKPYCVTKAMARAGFKDFRTNTYLGNMVFGINLSSHLQQKAVECAEAIGKDGEAWMLALDAMVDVGENKIVEDEYVKSELQDLTSHFKAVEKVERERRDISSFSDWNLKLENAFQDYLNSDPYLNIKSVIEKSIAEGQDSVLFHEVNSCPDFWERTRLVTGVNLAVPLLKCAKSIAESGKHANPLELQVK
ncbi:MAG: ATP-grasp domain-containing protein [Thermoproteota archaeon]